MTFIESDPQILGGLPVIANTRIDVFTVKSRLAGGDTVETLAAEYPGVPIAAFEAARRYPFCAPLHDWEQYHLTDAEREHFRELRAEHRLALRIAATCAALEEWAELEAEPWCCNGESKACTTQGSCGQRE